MQDLKQVVLDRELSPFYSFLPHFLQDWVNWAWSIKVQFTLFPNGLQNIFMPIWK